MWGTAKVEIDQDRFSLEQVRTESWWKSARLPVCRDVSKALGIQVLGLEPAAQAFAILLPLVMYEFRKNIERDFMVWENKAYKERPMLNKSDGDILKFRRYCRQFYPDQPEGERGAARHAAVG